MTEVSCNINYRSMKKISIDLSDIKKFINNKLNSNYDPSYITRHIIVAEIINHLENKDILDVGGYNGGMSKLIKNNNIITVDLVDNLEDKSYVKYDGNKLPFKNNSFHAVVSIDTLEHVKPENRKNMINEMIRVSKDLVILYAPFNDYPTRITENQANRFYRGMTNQDYIWLQEHIMNVLPSKSLFNNLNKKYHLTTFDHTSIGAWKILVEDAYFMANNINEVSDAISKGLYNVNLSYLKNIAKVDFPKIGYRKFIIISKKNKIEIKLPKYNKKLIDNFIMEAEETRGRSISLLSEEIGRLQNIINEDLNTK